MFVLLHIVQIDVRINFVMSATNKYTRRNISGSPISSSMSVDALVTQDSVTAATSQVGVDSFENAGVDGTTIGEANDVGQALKLAVLKAVPAITSVRVALELHQL